MTSTLQKPQQFTPGDPGTPDSTTTRYVTKTVRVPRYKLVPTSNKREAVSIVNSSIDAPYIATKILIREGPGKGGYITRSTPNWFKQVIDGYDNSTVTETITTLVPGRPATPETAIPAAWDATALSVKVLEQPARFTFKVGANLRSDQSARAGLSFMAPAAGTEQSYLTHGFKIENGVATVQSFPASGVPIAPGYEETISSALSVSPASVMRIDVIDSKVRYYIDDVLMAVQPSRLYTFPLHAGAALYTFRDAIVDPTFVSLEISGGGALQIKVTAQGADSARSEGGVRLRLVAVGGENTDGARLRLFAQGSDGSPGYGTAKIPMPTMGGFGYTGTFMTGTAHLAREFVALGADTAYAGGRVYLALGIFASTDDIPASIHGQAKGVFQILESTASFPHGGLYGGMVGGGAFEGAISPGVKLDAFGKLGVEFKGSLSILENFATSGAMGVNFTGQNLIDAAFITTGVGSAPLAGMLLVTADLSAAGVFAAGLTAGRAADASLDAAGELSMALSAQQVLTAALEALGHIGVEMGEPGKTVSVWSVNAATGGSTAYEQYPFNSFAVINGVSYGATADGIYELAGDTDAGEPIHAHLNMGQRNFGTPKLKTMPYAYLGAASDGAMVVRVTANGQTYTYRARASGDMQTQRVDFGRGLRANYFTLELMNEGGADFDLDVSEFAATELSRRI